MKVCTDKSTQEVVVDASLITSRSPADLPAFCRALFKMIEAG